MWAAVVCAAIAAWLVSRRDQDRRRARTLLAGSEASENPNYPDKPHTRHLRRLRATVQARVGHEWWCLVAGAVIALLGQSVLPLIAGAMGVPLAGRALRAAEARRERSRRSAAVIALCGTLAGEVRAGRQPAEALRTALDGAVDVGVASPDARSAVLAAARFGGDVPGALKAAAREPGSEGLLGLAACWLVAVDRGAGLAAGLERLEAALRSERDQQSDLRAQLAGARSTAVMLAGLPALGLLMGTALGAEPLRVLLHTPPGLACLAAGAVLEGVGVWWALRIVRGAERQ
ncbi:type II secretion system F family protein [Streptomyces luteocolor]|uniref:type II secretion system F family protein n=1 Tax=Streptomyces luteocolor TaxID=285500 RepID=UPI000853D73F|nr:type II secretion system F family protein [Streptomyces luteocolor]